MTLRENAAGDPAVPGGRTGPAPGLPLPPGALWPALAGLVLALMIHAATVLSWPDLWIMIDVNVYRAAGAAVVTGGPLYEGNILGALKFVYTPFAALVFVPLSAFPMEVLRYLANVGNVAMLVGTVWLCWGALGYRADRARLAASLALAAVTFWFEPIRTTTWLGQINLVLLLVLVWDLGRRRRWSGAGVGVTAGIKLTPGIFLPYLLVTGRCRAAVLAVVTGLATAVLGMLALPEASLRFWGSTFFDSNRMGTQEETTNQSLHGTVTRLLGEGAAGTLVWLVVALAVAGYGLWLARRADQRGHRLLGVTLVGLTGTLVSPFSWSHHWVWFVPLAVLLADLGLRGHRSGWLALVGLWLLVAPWPIPPLPPVGAAAPPMGLFLAPTAGGWEVLYGNCHVWAGLVSLLLAHRHLRRRPRPARDVPVHPGARQPSVTGV